jgi:hypothetical protein
MSNGITPAAAPLLCTISAGQSLSNAVACITGTVTRIWMPTSGWDGGLVTFQLSYDNITFYDLFDANSKEMAYNITTGTVVYTKPFSVLSTMWMKVRSGVRTLPKVQSADRIFKIEIV